MGSHIGDSGVALIHQMVNTMGFVWHERTGTLDAGIDGEIELRDPSTGKVANRVIFVQSKARDRSFPGENDRSFHYLCKQADVDYWMSADNPVLLVCSHPQTSEAWWMHIQSWFADPSHRASGRIDFDKRTQSFDHRAAHRLLNLADPHGRAHVAIADNRQESLTSNLLTVTIPPLLYRTGTTITNPREVIAQQQETGTADLRRDFILRGGYLHSWLPPQETALGHVTKGTTDAIETAEWACDPARQRWLVQLLNYALQRDVSIDCAWHNGRKIIYFRATADLKQRQIRGPSGRARLVFHPKFKKTKPEEISYCKHAALEWKFLQFGDEWYCALSPTFHYTRDGYRDSLFLSDYLSGIKQLDRNPAVYGHTRMWATYLQGDEGVLVPHETILTYGGLLDFTADRAIDDASWLADPRQTDTDESDGNESTETDELRLFEAKQ